MGTPIQTYICQTKCFYQNRVWNVGESLQFQATEKNPVPPKHFVPKAKYKPDPKTVPPQDPKTFAEWQKKEQEEARRAVGHGKPQTSIPGMPSGAAQPQNAEAAAGQTQQNAEGEGEGNSDPNSAFQ